FAARDFEYAAAMSGHGYLDDFARVEGKEIVLRVARMHQLIIRIFMVDAEQAAITRIGAVRQRDEAYEVIIVAELAELRRGTLVMRIKLRRVLQNGVAPADENIGRVICGDVVSAVDAGGHGLEAEYVIGQLRGCRLRRVIASGERE